ncbi:MAG TPA: CHRD domain-containing protein [Candidatus Eisenbacteria bacterium]
MKKMIWGAVASLALVALFAGMSQGGGKPFNVTLSGASEVPGPGDPDGTGALKLTVNPGLGEICYTLTWDGLDGATAAHIHRAPIGEAGPVVVPLEVSDTGSSNDCITIDKDLAREILQNPDMFYVNVHNETYPSGAIRAQLSGADDTEDEK